MNVHELKSVSISRNEDDQSHEAWLKTMESTLDEGKSTLALHAKASEALRSLHNKYKDDLSSELGADLSIYRAFQGKKRARALDLQALSAPTAEGQLLKKSLRNQSAREASELFRSIGADADKIKLIRRAYRIKVKEVLQATIQVSQSMPYVLASAAEAPKHSDNPWKWFSTPYYWRWGQREWDGSGGWRSVNHSENHITGVINVTSDMSLHGADDDDYSYTWAQSELWVRFQMPAAGIVEGWVLLQSVDNRFSGCLENEAGWSDASVEQSSSMYMRAFGPAGWGPRRYGTLAEYSRGDEEGCWSDLIFHPGGGRWVQLFSMDAYAAGQWVTVAIGIEDYNSFWVNDYSCDLGMVNRWFVRNIVLRSTGAP